MLLGGGERNNQPSTGVTKVMDIQDKSNDRTAADEGDDHMMRRAVDDKSGGR